MCGCVSEGGAQREEGERERMEEEGKLIMLKEKSERTSDFSSLKSKKI